MTIRYTIDLPGDRRLQFAVDPDRSPVRSTEGADWTALGFHQCPNCPLSNAEHGRCPAALDAQPLVEACSGLISHHSVRVIVEFGDRRRLSSDVDLQTALSSLLGLILSTSGCPILSRLRGMARVHLPFQTLEESQIRMVGAWLIGRLLEDNFRGSDSLQGLHELMVALGQVNRAFMNRLRHAASKDANLNALATLAASAMNVEFSLEEASEELGRYAIR